MLKCQYEASAENYLNKTWNDVPLLLGPSVQSILLAGEVSSHGILDSLLLRDLQ